MTAKFLLSLTVVLAGATVPTYGAACSGFSDLQSLLTAGSCDVGSVTFSGFSYNNTIAAAMVSVTSSGSGMPGSVGTYAGLAFQTTGGWSPTFSLNYTVTCNSCSFIGSQVNANLRAPYLST